MKLEERFNRVLAGLSHTGYTTEIEKCEARIFIEELYKQNQKYKEAINKIYEIINYEYDFYDDIAKIKDDIQNILNEVK